MHMLWMLNVHVIIPPTKQEFLKEFWQLPVCLVHVSKSDLSQLVSFHTACISQRDICILL